MPTSSSKAARIAIRLRSTISHLSRQLRAQSSHEGPGAAKLGVLGQLYRVGPLTPTQLALCERVKLQTLTRLIAELEAEKLIVRKPHECDARQSLLSLTASGIRVLNADRHRREASLASAVGKQLSAAECAQVLASCELIDRLANAIAIDAVGQESLDVPVTPSTPARRRRTTSKEPA